MFGQACLPVAPVGGAPGLPAGGAVCVEDVDGAVAATLLVLAGDAAAPAIPATAPVVASAPATIVAPSILEMVMRANLLGPVDCLCKPWSVLVLSVPVGPYKYGNRRM